MANDTGNRSDSIVYLTLVDFLIQLIFFGMFLFVAFYPSKTQDEPTLKPEFKKFGVPILEGFGQLINAENVPIFQKLAEYIHNKKDLVDLVDAIKLAGSISKLLEVNKFGEGFGKLINLENIPLFQKLADYIHNKKDLIDLIDAIKQAGSISKLLEINNIVEGAGGIESARKRLGVGQPACIKGKLSLMTVVAHDEFIEIKNITDIGRVVFTEIGLRVIEGNQYSFDQFTFHFKLMNQQKIDGQSCVHFVRYERLTKFEAPRLAVDKIFLIGR